MSRKRVHSSSIEADFHGLTSDQAAAKLLHLLDDHQGKAGFHLRIIHGKGTGTLAEVIQRVGRADPRVSAVERGFLNEGITTLVLSGQKAKASRQFAPIPSTSEIPPPPIRKRKR